MEVRRGQREASEMPGSVYKVIELVGTSPDSWEAAAQTALEAASSSVQDLRVAEVVQTDVRLEGNKIVEYRVKMSVSFKYHPEMHQH
jgi:flavin-binding protein dodecin